MIFMDAICRRSQLSWQILIVLAITLVSSETIAQQADQWAQARQELVELIAEGVKSPRILKAVADTERHLFVPECERQKAYFDMSLPIGGGV
ncbi:MAG: protein-L-isoaspartate(D-aspartate) O-methyltransferase, partial [Planctomycetia bacterium]|nr:protein-L-isoaspartate(D-aspartate) O-methyltransferase [Planctomycetia bacterium]